MMIIFDYNMGDFCGREIPPRLGLWIATHPRLALPCAEAAKAANLDFFGLAQRLDNAFKDRCYDDFGVLPGHLYYAGDFFYQIRFRHISLCLLHLGLFPARFQTSTLPLRRVPQLPTEL